MQKRFSVKVSASSTPEILSEKWTHYFKDAAEK